MLIDLIPENFIKVVDKVDTYQEAVRIAGGILVDNGCVEPRYVDKLVEVAETFKYIVIAPHIAMPHSRPEDGCIENGMSLLLLKEPIPFGHEEHDPVKAVFALAGKDHNSHLQLLSELADALDNESFMTKLLLIDNREDLIALLSANE